MSNCESIFNEVRKQHNEHNNVDFSYIFDSKNEDEDLGEFEEISKAQPEEQNETKDMRMFMRI